MRSLALAAIALAGCSSILGIEDLGGPGPTPPTDGDPTPDIPVASTLRLFGTARVLDAASPNGAPAVGMPISFINFATEQETDLDSTQPPAGSFDLQIETQGRVVDGALRLSPAPGVPTSREHFNYPHPFADETELAAQVLGDSFVSVVGGADTAAFVIVFAAQLNMEGKLVGRSGLQVESEAGQQVIYGDDAGLPQADLIETSSQGLAYIPNDLPAPHAITVRDGSTVIAERLVLGAANSVHFVIVRTDTD